MSRKTIGFINEYRIEEDTTILILTNKEGLIKECYIDTEDLQRLISLNVNWHLKWEHTCFDYYAAASIRYTAEDGRRKGTSISLQRFIMNAKPNETVDHYDHTPMNNRKYNLRVTTIDKNSQHRKGANKNSGTGVRNVNYGSEQKEYWVQFCKEGVRYKWIFPLSQFKEACEFAYIKRKEIFGEFSGNG